MTRPCPSCGEPLVYEVMFPPIPMTIRRWIDPATAGDGPDEVELDCCPVCEADLPTDDRSFDREASVAW